MVSAPARRVVRLDVAHHSIAPTNGYEAAPIPDWLAELSPAEQRLVAGREYGHLAPAASVCLISPAALRASRLSRALTDAVSNCWQPSRHPTPLAEVAAGGGIDLAERWQWDRAG